MIVPSLDRNLLASKHPMTVCIAGAHESGDAGASIMLITDSRVSTLGGSFSEDRNAKYVPVHRDWIGMYAGNIEETRLILKEVSRQLFSTTEKSFENVV